MRSRPASTTSPPRGDELVDVFYGRLFAVAPGREAALRRHRSQTTMRWLLPLPDRSEFDRHPLVRAGTGQKRMLLAALVPLRKSLRDLDSVTAAGGKGARAISSPLVRAQDPMPTNFAERLDVGTGGPEDPEAAKPGHGDQGEVVGVARVVHVDGGFHAMGA
jgi:hypothetical protein